MRLKTAYYLLSRVLIALIMGLVICYNWDEPPRVEYPTGPVVKG